MSKLHEEQWELLNKIKKGNVMIYSMGGNLKEIGITIVVSTPYMDEASKCDRVALIQKAELMAVDKPENIVNGFEKEILSIR